MDTIHELVVREPRELTALPRSWSALQNGLREDDQTQRLSSHPDDRLPLQIEVSDAQEVGAHGFDNLLPTVKSMKVSSPERGMRNELCY